MNEEDIKKLEEILTSIDTKNKDSSIKVAEAYNKAYNLGKAYANKQWEFKIKNKIKKLQEQYEYYSMKWQNGGMMKEHPFYKYLVRIEAEIDILEEILEE